MNVFLDTNVFYNNWFVSNANFKLLFYYLNNENKDLLLSEVVNEEVNNIRGRELILINSEIDRLIKKRNKLCSKPLDETTIGGEKKPYDIKKILKERVNFFEIIGYENVSHLQVVKRALNSIKPFAGQEKGYRDTLIWLSFLLYLKNKDRNENVAFITNNKNDFFTKKNGKLAFNDDLQKDIDELSLNATIVPYLNIYDFVSENIDRLEHAFDREAILDEQEDFLIDNTEGYLNLLNNNDLTKLLNTKVFSDKLTSVIGIESEVFEGLEDPDIKSVKSLSDTNVYIDCYYEMRRVNLFVTVETIEYKQHASEIDSINTLWNVEIDGDYVELSFLLRTAIDASFKFDTKLELASDLSINGISIK